MSHCHHCGKVLGEEATRRRVKTGESKTANGNTVVHKSDVFMHPDCAAVHDKQEFMKFLFGFAVVVVGLAVLYFHK
jgi:hypothetical protein